MIMHLAGATDIASDAVRGLSPPSILRHESWRTDAAAPIKPQPSLGETWNNSGPAAPISTDELAEMLRRVNLTFDLFEIAAKYSVDQEGGRIRVTLFNTRTGEIIRRIPPAEFQAGFDSVREGLGLQVNRFC